MQDAVSPAALDAAREALDRLAGEEPFSISTVLRGSDAGRATVSPATKAEAEGGAAGTRLEGEAGDGGPLRFVETLLPWPYRIRVTAPAGP